MVTYFVLRVVGAAEKRSSSVRSQGNQLDTLFSLPFLVGMTQSEMGNEGNNTNPINVAREDYYNTHSHRNADFMS
jgi:hypothetical protein